VSHHGAIDAYSEDLRRKIVQALQQRRMNKSEAARAFGMSLSSVKRYAKLADRREYLQKVAGVSVSESTLSRTLRKMGFGRKN
jgi:transposase